MSMAGGWFFLMVNESFVLGGHDFRLPGRPTIVAARLYLQRSFGLGP